VPVSGANDEKFTVQNAGGAYNVDLGAVQRANHRFCSDRDQYGTRRFGHLRGGSAHTNDITFQSSSVFSVNETQLASAGGLFTTLGAQAPTSPAAGASNTGNALAALTALTSAISNLGLVQGQVGAGENKLQYASNLAQSQITNVSAAEAGLRDADVAAAAANLTKAQVLQQTSLAALSQANSAPQAVLALLKNF